MCTTWSGRDRTRPRTALSGRWPPTRTPVRPYCLSPLLNGWIIVAQVTEARPEHFFPFGLRPSEESVDPLGRLRRHLIDVRQRNAVALLIMRAIGIHPATERVTVSQEEIGLRTGRRPDPPPSVYSLPVYLLGRRHKGSLACGFDAVLALPATAR